MKTMIALAVAAAAATVAVPATSYAAQCRNAAGKFVKCPEKKAATPKRCKSARGQFVKCGTPGAKPV